VLCNEECRAEWAGGVEVGSGSSMLNGVSGMIGETAVVTKPVSDAHQPGSVFTRGEEWYAVSLFPGTTIDAGTTVVVADVERGLLVVYATDST
jgi:membrane-bound ClpP family serine protease